MWGAVTSRGVRGGQEEVGAGRKLAPCLPVGPLAINLQVLVSASVLPSLFKDGTLYVQIPI